MLPIRSFIIHRRLYNPPLSTRKVQYPAAKTYSKPLTAPYRMLCARMTVLSSLVKMSRLAVSSAAVWVFLETSAQKEYSIPHSVNREL